MALRAARQVGGLAAARPEEACGEIKFQLRLARKHQIHRLISTRAKTVLGVRLGAAGLSEGLRAARRAAGLRGNGSVTKRPRQFFTRR